MLGIVQINVIYTEMMERIDTHWYTKCERVIVKRQVCYKVIVTSALRGLDVNRMIDFWKECVLHIEQSYMRWCYNKTFEVSSISLMLVEFNWRSILITPKEIFRNLRLVHFFKFGVQRWVYDACVHVREAKHPLTYREHTMMIHRRPKTTRNNICVCGRADEAQLEPHETRRLKRLLPQHIMTDGGEWENRKLE